MNKFEKLIEYIINDEDQKARELFHDIVVEKSRGIYESIMDEESMEEHVHGGKVEDLTHELQDEEAMGEGEGEEFDVAGDEEGFAGDEHGDEDFDDMSGGEEHIDAEMHGEHGEIEDKVMNIDAKLDELLAKFDEIMGDEAGSGMSGSGKSGSGQSGEEGFGGEEEHGMFEAEGSGKSGSGKSGSGKSGSGMMEAAGSGKSGKSGSGKSGSGTSAKSGKSGKGSAEMMREYVDRIGDIFGGQGDAAEGDAVGAAGKKVSVNAKPGSVGPGADFGGHTATSKGGVQNQDGTSPTKASNEYTKGEGKLIGNVGNTPGGDKKLSAAGSGHGAEKKGSGEGKLAGHDGSAPINKKSEIGGRVR